MKMNSVTYNQADELTKVVRNFLEKKSTFELDSDEQGMSLFQLNKWKIYPLLANIMQVFLPTGNYQLFYTQYPQGFISIIAKPHDK